ncbi:MAG: helicase-related protein [Culicoidibacterales bacterium]
MKHNRVVMIFVPTIDVGNYVYSKLVGKLGSMCAFVYSSDEKRQTKVQGLRDRTIKVLITTTILERGVTIDLCEVIVIDADHDVFDWSALVQISGRVDRKSADALAQIFFIAQTRTKAMKVAIQEIKQCNDLAKERGLLY